MALFPEPGVLSMELPSFPTAYSNTCVSREDTAALTYSKTQTLDSETPQLRFAYQSYTQHH